MKAYTLLLILLLPLITSAEVKNCDSCSIKKYTKSEIRDISPYKLRLLRNEIYARKGYIFSDSLLRNHFNSKVWYTPATKDVTLSEIEKYNVELFAKTEKEAKRELPRYKEILLDFLISINEYSVYEKEEYRTSIEKYMPLEQQDLMNEILGQFKPETFPLSSSLENLYEQVTKETKNGRNSYTVSTDGYEIRFSKDCIIKDSPEEEAHEHSEILIFQYKEGKISFKAFHVAG